MVNCTAAFCKAVLAFILILMMGPRSEAASSEYFLLGKGGKRSYNLVLLAQSFSYSDIAVSADDEAFVYGPSTGFAIGLRLHQFFMFSLVQRTNTQDQRKTTGFAGRAFVPGFFLVGDNIGKFLTSFTTRRIHTYFEGEVGLSSIVDELGVESKYVETVGRLGIEITVKRGFYLDLSYGVASYKGNNTTVGGVGLGVRF